jgi:hypothetical protein
MQDGTYKQRNSERKSASGMNEPVLTLSPEQ